VPGFLIGILFLFVAYTLINVIPRFLIVVRVLRCATRTVPTHIESVLKPVGDGLHNSLVSQSSSGHHLPLVLNQFLLLPQWAILIFTSSRSSRCLVFMRELKVLSGFVHFNGSCSRSAHDGSLLLSFAVLSFSFAILSLGGRHLAVEVVTTLLVYVRSTCVP